MDVQSFSKNHPKNLIGYALAVDADEDTHKVFKNYVIESVADARQDAVSLNFIRPGQEDDQLTLTGRESVRTLRYHYGSTQSALQEIKGLTGSSTRLFDVLPVMGSVARQTLLAYPLTEVLVAVLDSLADEGNRDPSLAKLAKTLGRDQPVRALDIFVNPSSREQVRGSRGDDLRLAEFDSGEVYWTNTTFQYKALLYHSGILSTRGHDKKSTLDPHSEVWSLEDPMIPHN